ncbi:glycoside hydrolase family 9 protein [Nafulsella turpanensis]|uniref:glycoside hydrolase family 9 protein n=1 Tax=Nafulsella turpanensis TaxID=1265690 RepID=UPI000348954A|nr:glycoside hydrolase family 9 protein [Nafulsella turpanensis]
MTVRNIKSLGILASFGICLSCTPAATEETEATLNEQIRLNQLGFYPEGPKVAVVAGDVEADVFYVISTNLKDTVFSGRLSERRQSSYSGKTTRIADFSEMEKEGTFVVSVPGVGQSYPVTVGPEVYEDLTKAALKGFYFQRVSTALPAEYAGEWARAAGHPDTVVQIHASAATPGRPEGTTISAPLGWYDAGDYNKYIVNSGISTGTLLSLHEEFPAYTRSLSLTIPEGNNELPDLLDESLWNLRWMLAMQDPADGGVYHKLTTAEFEGMVMPADAKNTRYVVQKSTAATLDFAAVMAQAARIFRDYEEQLPGLADTFLQASEKAWAWAEKNPDQLYDQPAMNEKYKPAVNTGAYGDDDVSDERVWAAAELWATTGKEQYQKAISLLPEDSLLLVPSWGQVRALGYYTLLRHADKLEEQDPQLLQAVKEQVLALAGSLTEEVDANAYATVMGRSAEDFVWGSSAVAANQGIALIEAYQLSGEKAYLDHALSNLDYLLGRNATGYSFVTGYGDKTPMFPHHRPSEADGIEAPVPGLLAGGPNPGQQDKCDYPSNAADESYVDATCSYASNEIAINWNAPLVYLTAALEALKQEAAYVQDRNN